MIGLPMIYKTNIRYIKTLQRINLILNWNIENIQNCKVCFFTWIYTLIHLDTHLIHCCKCCSKMCIITIWSWIKILTRDHLFLTFEPLHQIFYHFRNCENYVEWKWCHYESFFRFIWEFGEKISWDIWNIYIIAFCFII